MMRPLSLLTLWLLACTDGRVDSDPADSDTGDCADGYDAETFIAERLPVFCEFYVTCPHVRLTIPQCMQGFTNTVRGNACFQPCTARLCIEQIESLAECSDYFGQAGVCDEIIQCGQP